MFRILLVLFLVVPIVEIYLLIKVGGVIGALPTVFLVVFTAVLGAFLLRMQGFTTLNRMRSSMERGELPAVEMLEGVMLLVSGAMLLTPGFFTDTLGFLCLIPPLRRKMAIFLIEKAFIVQMQPPGGPDSTPRGPRVIRGEYHRDD